MTVCLPSVSCIIFLSFVAGFIHCKSREIISDVQVILEPDKGMIYISEGSFTMGNGLESAAADERPAHEVLLSAYYISQNLVTNEQYLAFWEDENGGNSIQNTPLRSGSLPWPDIVDVLPKHPVVGISWIDAKAYAEWMSYKTGKSYRLPTEAEWEKAARGTDQRLYPWGNEAPMTNNRYRANFSQDENTADGFFRTSPVSYYNGINLKTENGESPYGLYDMSGNVWEWVEDWYNLGYYARSPQKDPKGPFSNSSGTKVIRGGSYQDDENAITSMNRNYEYYRTKQEYIGFRIAMETQ